MTYVRTSVEVESQSLERDETNSLIELSSDRTLPITGGFLDNWDDQILSNNLNNTQTELKLHWYRVRVFTTKPCVLYSSELKDIRLANLAPGGPDTTFNQMNMSNGVIKKFETTVDGGFWSELKHTFKTKRNLKDCMWKIQLVNKDPAGQDSMFYGIVEFGITYDATSNL